MCTKQRKEKPNPHMAYMLMEEKIKQKMQALTVVNVLNNSAKTGTGATILPRDPELTEKEKSKPRGIWVEETETAVAPRQGSTWCVL